MLYSGWGEILTEWKCLMCVKERCDRVISSNEDMILALAGQFKQLSHEPEELNGIRTRFFQVHETIFPGSWDNCLNCPASARIISSFDFKHRTSYNISFILYFPIPHNALCLPPKFCINYCCGMLLGICRPPKSISQQ